MPGISRISGCRPSKITPSSGAARYRGCNTVPGLPLVPRLTMILIESGTLLHVQFDPVVPTHKGVYGAQEVSFTVDLRAESDLKVLRSRSVRTPKAGHPLLENRGLFL